jgi:hypothetical protein
MDIDYHGCILTPTHRGNRGKIIYVQNKKKDKFVQYTCNYFICFKTKQSYKKKKKNYNNNN